MLANPATTPRDLIAPEPMDAARGVRWRDRALIAYRRGPEHPAKIRIVRWLARRLTGGRVRLNYADGATIAMDPADYIGWTVFTEGHYEPATLRLALRIMAREPGLFVDVGAHCGWYTCAVARLMGCTVVAIEADCGNCAQLRDNIELGKLANVVVFNGAVGANFEAVEMDHPAHGNSGTAAIRSGRGTGVLHGNLVATVPLEALLTRIARPPARPVLVKIDVEGSEADVLAGLDFAGPFRPKHVLMEFDPTLFVRSWKSFKSVRAFFADRDYDLLDICGRPLLDADVVPECNIWARERSVLAAPAGFAR
jgi:FkbM family methyltransferase